MHAMVRKETKLTTTVLSSKIGELSSTSFVHCSPAFQTLFVFFTHLHVFEYAAPVEAARHTGIFAAIAAAQIRINSLMHNRNFNERKSKADTYPSSRF